MSGATIQRYTVRTRHEQTSCHECGAPITTGDVAYSVRDFEAVTCSRRCGAALLAAPVPDWDRGISLSDFIYS